MLTDKQRAEVIENIHLYDKVLQDSFDQPDPKAMQKAAMDYTRLSDEALMFHLGMVLGQCNMLLEAEEQKKLGKVIEAMLHGFPYLKDTVQ